MESRVRHLRPVRPEPDASTVDGTDSVVVEGADAIPHPDAAADPHLRSLSDADRQAYWDDLAALRAQLAQVRAG